MFLENQSKSTRQIKKCYLKFGPELGMMGTSVFNQVIVGMLLHQQSGEVKWNHSQLHRIILYNSRSFPRKGLKDCDSAIKDVRIYSGILFSKFPV